MQERTNSGPELRQSLSSRTTPEIESRYGKIVKDWLEQDQVSKPNSPGSIEERLKVVAMLFSRLGDAGHGVASIGNLHGMASLMEEVETVLIQHGVIFRPPPMFVGVNSDHTSFDVNKDWLAWYTQTECVGFTPQKLSAKLYERFSEEIQANIIPEGMKDEYYLGVELDNFPGGGGKVTVVRKTPEELKNKVNAYFANFTIEPH